MAVSGAIEAQELAPRAYWPTPTGTNIFVLGYAHSTGDLIFDSTVPVVDASASSSAVLASYQRSFGLAGRSASVLVNVPYTWGTAEGIVSGIPARRDVSTFGDARLRLAVNLLGAPAMDPSEFQQLVRAPKPILGVSLQLSAPTGGYDDDRVINAGANRWATRFGVGFIHPFRPTWLVEAELGGWVFADNDEFVGATREQDAIVSGELHLIKVLQRGLWTSLDLNYYYGGRTTVDGVENPDLLRNSRAGATLWFPFQRRHALRASFSSALLTNNGGDVDTYQFAYQRLWR